MNGYARLDDAEQNNTQPKYKTEKNSVNLHFEESINPMHNFKDTALTKLKTYLPKRKQVVVDKVKTKTGNDLNTVSNTLTTDNTPYICIKNPQFVNDKLKDPISFYYSKNGLFTPFDDNKINVNEKNELIIPGKKGGIKTIRRKRKHRKQNTHRK